MAGTETRTQDRQQRFDYIQSGTICFVKDEMYGVAQRLEAEGFTRKARALMNMVYKLEEWQNTRA